MNNNENRYDMDRLVDLAGLMCRKKQYGDMRDRFVGYYSLEKPITISMTASNCYENRTFAPEAFGYKFGFIWEKELYLIPNRTTEVSLGLCDEDGYRNAPKLFFQIAGVYDNAIFDGEGVIPTQFMLEEFGDCFERAVDNFENCEFWLDEPYISPLTMAQAHYHSPHHTKGVKYAKGRVIKEAQLYDTRVCASYASFPLLILVKLPLDTLVYNDLRDGMTLDNPMRICPSSSVQEDKEEVNH